LIPSHDQKFKLWMLALVYLVNNYHNTLSPEEQINMFDTLVKNSPRDTIELAKQYNGKQRPWLQGFQRYFQSEKKWYSANTQYCDFPYQKNPQLWELPVSNSISIFIASFFDSSPDRIGTKKITCKFISNFSLSVSI